MLKIALTSITGFFVLLSLSFDAEASAFQSAASQTEQDKARQASLAPQQQEFKSDRASSGNKTIIFPKEDVCKYINGVLIESEDDKLTKKLLHKLASQANSHCLGIKGINLLAQALQNELISQGYITSLIDIPPQDIANGILKLTLAYGKVGSIAWDAKKENSKISLWNSLPFTKDEILKLSDLEQGMANLQRLPGSSAHMQLKPGKQNGETEIVLTRQMKKPWQIGAWLDDAGSRATGRYQGGGSLYLYDLTTLNDILYVAAGGDVEYNQHDDGNHNASIYYSIPFGYWNASVYASQSTYLQQFKGRFSSTDYESKNRYFSATIERLLSQTRTQKTSLVARIFKSRSRYYFGGSELSVMRKQNPAWELSLRHQHYFNNKVVDAGLSVQRRLGWLSSMATPEEKAGLFDNEARVLRADIKALMKFASTGEKFTYAPALSVQISPDKLSSDNSFNIGSRWSVRGFDGERTLSSSEGWYMRNDFIWDMPVPNQQFYLGLDIGKIIGSDQYQQGKVLSGTVAGLRGRVLSTEYDLFLGTPVTKPKSYHTDALNMGFSLQWRY
ncbi:ShlB/FhaC/HecB family hemolysin secretion/activation protein [Leclercia sp.]|uniref:ShlB/FhaC/HecB family hemolysin secretion/activation protein n=1 Tax=Leclercia sp. TaxID=1898428 RepID=UPI002FDE18B1